MSRAWLRPRSLSAGPFPAIQFPVPISIQHPETTAEIIFDSLLLEVRTLPPLLVGQPPVPIKIELLKVTGAGKASAPASEVLLREETVLIEIHTRKHRLEPLIVRAFQAGVPPKLLEADPPIPVLVTPPGWVRCPLGQFITRNIPVLVFVEVVEKTPFPLFLQRGGFPGRGELLVRNPTIPVVVIAAHEAIAQRPTPTSFHLAPRLGTPLAQLSLPGRPPFRVVCLTRQQKRHSQKNREGLEDKSHNGSLLIPARLATQYTCRSWYKPSKSGMVSKLKRF